MILIGQQQLPTESAETTLDRVPILQGHQVLIASSKAISLGGGGISPIWRGSNNHMLQIVEIKTLTNAILISLNYFI